MASIRKYFYCFTLFAVSFEILTAQANFSFSNPEAIRVIKAENDIDQYRRKYIWYGDEFISHFDKNFNADSLKQYLIELMRIPNRNTINDHPSRPNEGIRAARNWLAHKTSYWASLQGHAMLTSDFSFDYSMCGRLRHSQFLNIIPGTGPDRKEIIIAEAHLDSRCESLCDTACLAYGAEDNGSGVALMLELSRVFSSVELNRTLVIIWTTGEEQGLGGARAFAAWCKANAIPVKAVFNNDVIGGVECGITSSPPSCPGPGQIDSMRVRIFSSGLTNSMPKMLARLSKLVYDRNVVPLIPVSLKVDLMSGEDRTGRGGDHIPFREQGYSAIRFTSSYEHGDGNPDQADYHDRQHSIRDVLGIDADGDQLIDSFYVHFNYLRHNTMLNACSIVNISEARQTSSIDTVYAEPGFIWIELPQIADSLQHVVGIRNFTSVGFDQVIITRERKIKLELKASIFYVSLSVLHPSGWISMFGNEKNIRTISNTLDEEDPKGIVLYQNKPNPFDDVSYIPIFVEENVSIEKSFLSIHDERGKLIGNINIQLHKGMNEVIYPYSVHNYQPGTYIYTLWVNNRKIDSKKLQIIN